MIIMEMREIVNVILLQGEVSHFSQKRHDSEINILSSAGTRDNITIDPKLSLYDLGMKVTMFAPFMLLLACQVLDFTHVKSVGATDITLGLMSPSEESFIHTAQLKPAVDIAVENVAEMVRLGHYLNFTLVVFFNETGAGCNAHNGEILMVAAYMYLQFSVDAFIGPPCSSEAASVGDLADYWNLPMVTAVMPSFTFLNPQIRFPTMSRLGYRLISQYMCVVETARLFHWNTFAIIHQYEDNDNSSLVAFRTALPDIEIDDDNFIMEYVPVDDPFTLPELLLAVLETNNGRN